MTLTKPDITTSLVGKWKCYPAYKDSGVEWLGEIAEHWEVHPIWLLFKLGRGRVISNLEIQDNPGKYPVYSSQTENDGTLGHIRTYDFDGTYLTWTTDGANAGTVFYRQGKFNCTNVCGTLLPRDPRIDLRFFRHALSCATSYYVRHDINPKLMNGVMARIRVQVPPISEQHAIATFLDREIAKINALIVKKERLIELLQEKRAGLISQAVTKGLDPTAQMKDSGVEWLGEIPAHWEASLVKRVARIRYGLGQPPAELDEGKPLIRATNIKSGRVVSEGMLYVDPKDIPPGKNAELSDGEIIVVRSGAYTGDSAIITKQFEGAIAGYDMVVTVTKGYSPFIAWQLLSKEIRELQFGFYELRAAQPHLNAEELGGTIILIPPLAEQQAIANYLDHETAKIDALISRIREGVEKLKEYSTALISAAVTGKIDVRGHGEAMETDGRLSDLMNSNNQDRY